MKLSEQLNKSISEAIVMDMKYSDEKSQKAKEIYDELWSKTSRIEALSRIITTSIRDKDFKNVFKDLKTLRNHVDVMMKIAK